MHELAEQLHELDLHLVVGEEVAGHLVVAGLVAVHGFVTASESPPRRKAALREHLTPDHARANRKDRMNFVLGSRHPPSIWEPGVRSARIAREYPADPTYFDGLLGARRFRQGTPRGVDQSWLHHWTYRGPLPALSVELNVLPGVLPRLIGRRPKLRAGVWNEL